jgi:hypothetical protein
MKYFIDTEFREEPGTIDLISIGIVSEDGRKYYAISKDFNVKKAWNSWQTRTGQGDMNNKFPKEYWLRDNVLKPIFKELCDEFMDLIINFSYRNFKKLIELYGKSNKQIAEEIKMFVYNNDHPDPAVCSHLTNKSINDGIEFYGYYADYDWVVFCWLFGKMIDLPKGFPMYCKDLKQMLDEKPIKHKVEVSKMENDKYIAGSDPYYLEWKDHVDYPKQSNEHNALADAEWNLKLYNFLNEL